MEDDAEEGVEDGEAHERECQGDAHHETHERQGAEAGLLEVEALFHLSGHAGHDKGAFDERIRDEQNEREHRLKQERSFPCSYFQRNNNQTKYCSDCTERNAQVCPSANDILMISLITFFIMIK